MRTIEAMPDPDEIELILDLERELQSPECRSDAARLSQLLAPEFIEIGSSGRLWSHPEVLAMLTEESASGAEPIQVANLRGRTVVDGVVVVHWDSRRAGREARRTSLWQRRNGSWQLVFHQGTPVENGRPGDSAGL